MTAAISHLPLLLVLLSVPSKKQKGKTPRQETTTKNPPPETNQTKRLHGRASRSTSNRDHPLFFTDTVLMSSHKCDG